MNIVGFYVCISEYVTLLIDSQETIRKWLLISYYLSLQMSVVLKTYSNVLKCFSLFLKYKYLMKLYDIKSLPICL